MSKQKLFVQRGAEEAMDLERRIKLHMRVFSWSEALPKTLWYQGRVPAEIDSYHEVARIVGLSNVISGEIMRDSLGLHWVLLQGVKT